jgi:hypothetical protein
MNRKSSILISAGLVLALMAGMASRALTFHPATAAAAPTPTRIVVQQAAPAPAPPAYVESDAEGR